MSKRVAIVQSSYIPWKGYFDLIAGVDEFILFDDVQFTRRDWRNRNRIKGPNGTHWLTIPVVTKGRYFQAIDETAVADPGWAEQHWRSVELAYGKAPHFRSCAGAVRSLYEAAGTQTALSRVNHGLLAGLCGLLGIATPLTWSRDYGGDGQKTDRLVALCRAAGATTYLSGPSARAYMEPDKFAAAGIALEYMDYSGYPEYPQRHGPFEHAVSILDLLFNVGPDAPACMKAAGRTRGSTP